MHSRLRRLVSLFVECESETGIDRLHRGLSESGTVLIPINNYGFRRKFVWVNDRFGVSWQLNLAKASAIRKRSWEIDTTARGYGLSPLRAIEFDSPHRRAASDRARIGQLPLAWRICFLRSPNFEPAELPDRSSRRPRSPVYRRFHPDPHWVQGLTYYPFSLHPDRETHVRMV